MTDTPNTTQGKGARNIKRTQAREAARALHIEQGGRLNAVGNLGGLHGNYGHRPKGRARQAALDAGLSRFMGTPCVHGHSGERYARTKDCCECSRLKALAYKRRDPAANVARARVWSLANQEKTRATGRAFQARRRAALMQAQPGWLSEADKTRMDDIWKNCPPDMSVDHMVPLTSDKVCGLHVPWNLQYLSPHENSSKLNRYWPNDWSGNNG